MLANTTSKDHRNSSKQGIELSRSGIQQENIKLRSELDNVQSENVDLAMKSENAKSEYHHVGSMAPSIHHLDFLIQWRR